MSARAAISASPVPEMRLRLPEPGAVEVQRHPSVPAGLRERAQLVPGGQQVAGIAQAGARAAPHRASPGSPPGESATRDGRAVGEPLVAESVEEHAGRPARDAADARGRGALPVASPARSHSTRSTDCCAMIPLGNIAAAGLPRSSRTCSSSTPTGPESPYRSHRPGSSRRSTSSARLRMLVGGASPSTARQASVGLRRTPLRKRASTAAAAAVSCSARHRLRASSAHPDESSHCVSRADARRAATRLG